MSKFVKDKFGTKKRPVRKDFIHLVGNSHHQFIYINIGDGNASGADLNWIPVPSPLFVDEDLDRYLQAMFENTPESEAFLTKWHLESDVVRPQNNIDLSFLKTPSK
jgi:hypothetical protein